MHSSVCFSYFCWGFMDFVKCQQNRLRESYLFCNFTNFEGVGQPFSPRTLLHVHLPFGRGPTQGTCRQELTAERLLPSLFFMYTYAYTYTFTCIHMHIHIHLFVMGDTARSRNPANGIIRPELPATTICCSFA